MSCQGDEPRQDSANPQPVRCHLLSGGPRAAVGAFPYRNHRTVAEIDAGCLVSATNLDFRTVAPAAEGADAFPTPFSISANPVSVIPHGEVI